MLINSLKSVIQLTSLLTISILFLALWQNPSLGFSATAALAIASVFATRWSIQKACKLREKSKCAFKGVQVACLLILSLSFSTAGLMAGAEYGGTEKLTGQVMSELTNQQEMTAIAGAFQSHLQQARGF